MNEQKIITTAHLAKCAQADSLLKDWHLSLDIQKRAFRPVFINNNNPELQFRLHHNAKTNLLDVYGLYPKGKKPIKRARSAYKSNTQIEKLIRNLEQTFIPSYLISLSPDNFTNFKPTHPFRARWKNQTDELADVLKTKPLTYTHKKHKVSTKTQGDRLIFTRHHNANSWSVKGQISHSIAVSLSKLFMEKE